MQRCILNALGVSLLQLLAPMPYHACRMHWKYKDYFAPVAIDMVHAENASETMQGSMLLLLKKNLIYDLYGAKSSGATVCFYP